MTEKFELENFPTSESAKRQLSYVSDGFYDKSYVGKWLFQIMGLEYDSVRDLFEGLPNQFFVETATWGLRFHEEKWGLPIRENLSYEERRKLIYQKRDYRAPITPYRMEQYLKATTGFEVFIADINDPGKYGFIAPHPNVFKAYFIGEGSLDSKVVQEALNRLKQSHTTYIVNDRVEIVIDNSNLEIVMLRSINIHLRFLFWNILNADTRNSLRNKISIHGADEKIEDVSLVTRINLWFLDGSVNLDGSRTLNAECRKEAL